MAKNPKTNRTQLTDLPAVEQEITGQEMAQVQGGAINLNASKSNRNVIICQRCGKVGVDKNPCCPPPSEPNI